MQFWVFIKVTHSFLLAHNCCIQRNKMDYTSLVNLLIYTWPWYAQLLWGNSCHSCHISMGNSYICLTGIVGRYWKFDDVQIVSATFSSQAGSSIFKNRCSIMFVPCTVSIKLIKERDLCCGWGDLLGGWDSCAILTGVLAQTKHWNSNYNFRCMQALHIERLAQHNLLSVLPWTGRNWD